jgi:hypothetical protein
MPSFARVWAARRRAARCRVWSLGVVLIVIASYRCRRARPGVRWALPGFSFAPLTGAMVPPCSWRGEAAAGSKAETAMVAAFAGSAVYIALSVCPMAGAVVRVSRRAAFTCKGTRQTEHQQRGATPARLARKHHERGRGRPTEQHHRWTDEASTPRRALVLNTEY